MQIEYSITEEDYLALKKNLSDNSYTRKLITTSERLEITVILGIVLVFVIRPTLGELLFISYVLAGVYFLIYPLVLPYLQKSRDTFEYKNNVTMQTMTLICKINEEGVWIDNGIVQSYVKWDSLLRISEDEQRFYLYPTDEFAYIVKKTNTNLNKNDQEIFNKTFISYMKKPFVKEQLFSPNGLKIRKILILFYIVFIFFLIDW